MGGFLWVPDDARARRAAQSDGLIRLTILLFVCSQAQALPSHTTHTTSDQDNHNHNPTNEHMYMWYVVMRGHAPLRVPLEQLRTTRFFQKKCTSFRLGLGPFYFMLFFTRDRDQRPEGIYQYE